MVTGALRYPCPFLKIRISNMCDIFLRDDTEDCGNFYQVLEIFYHFFPVMHLDATRTKFTQLRRGRRE